MTGGASSPKDFLDSTEILVERDEAWTNVDSLTLPTALRGPFMINVQNSVFLTGIRTCNLQVNKLVLRRRHIPEWISKRGFCA